jgi:hypothetical protein
MDAAGVHEDHPVGHLAREVHLVRDHQQRHALVGQRSTTCSTSPTSSGSSAEVISSHSITLGFHGQRAGDGHALLLAA